MSVEQYICVAVKTKIYQNKFSQSYFIKTSFDWLKLELTACLDETVKSEMILKEFEKSFSTKDEFTI